MNQHFKEQRKLKRKMSEMREKKEVGKSIVIVKESSWIRIRQRIVRT